MTIALETYPIYIHWVFSVGKSGSIEISMDSLHSDKCDENDQVD